MDDEQRSWISKGIGRCRLSNALINIIRERLKGMLANVRAFFKIVLFLFLAGLFLLTSYCVYFFERDHKKRLKKYLVVNQFFSSLALRSFGVKVKTTNLPSTKEGNFLVVSNHTGFIDILAIESVCPTTFVTSQEMRETPFLGLITEMAGCLYVERRSRSNLVNEIKNISKALQDGLVVTLYPEATSHNAEEILPFKRNMIMAAAHAGVPVQPVVFNIRQINDGPFLLKYRDSVCWYGDIPFHVGIWNLFKLKSIEVELEFLPQWSISPEDNKAFVADKLHQQISLKFSPVIKDRQAEELGI